MTNEKPTNEASNETADNVKSTLFGMFAKEVLDAFDALKSVALGDDPKEDLMANADPFQSFTTPDEVEVELSRKMNDLAQYCKEHRIPFMGYAATRVDADAPSITDGAVYSLPENTPDPVLWRVFLFHLAGEKTVIPSVSNMVELFNRIMVRMVQKRMYDHFVSPDEAAQATDHQKIVKMFHAMLEAKRLREILGSGGKEEILKAMKSMVERLQEQIFSNSITEQKEG